MESLLKLSGLLSEEDGDRTDLGTLEKRLADQTNRNSSPGTPSKSPNGSSNTHTPARPSSESQHTTPKLGNSATPNSTLTSPEPPKEANKPKGKDGEEEVEALSDMMCSLVTNNCGETRYIGTASSNQVRSKELIAVRLLIRLFDLFAQRDTVGQRKDGRQFLSRHDIFSSRGR